MLSRRTVRALASLYQEAFSETGYTHHRGITTSSTYKFRADDLYDFLFEADFDSKVCDEMRGMRYERNLQDFIMRRAVSEPASKATRYFLALAEAVLKEAAGEERYFDRDDRKLLLGQLELDGYALMNGRLVGQEPDVVDATETQDALTSLLRELGLATDVTTHHLRLSEDHYLHERWDDCIANARKVLEELLKGIARAVSSRQPTPLSEDKINKPVEVRNYLEAQGLFEKEETRAIAGAYGLLSHAGGHPYIARKEQARLLRHVALTYAQFVALQWKGKAFPS